MNFDTSPACPSAIAADELSRWRDGDLPSDRADYLASHVAGCAACQSRLADANRLADRLNAIPAPPLDGARFWADLRAHMSRAPLARRRLAGNGGARRLLGVGAVAAVLLVALGFAQLFASRGTGPLSGPSITATQALTSTAMPTSTPAATVNPTSSTAGLIVAAGCPTPGFWSTPPAYTTVGAFKLSIPRRVLDYPNALLPNDAPNAPYQVALTKSEAEQADSFHPDPQVNPSLQSGYAIQICNPTGVPHTLTSLSVAIASFVPSSGPVRVWHVCGDGPYDSVTKQTTTGCGGGTGEVLYLAATFPDDHTGATALATPDPKIPGQPSLPITIGANESTIVLVAVNGITSQGTYALTLDLSVDGATPTAVAPSDGSFLIAPAAVVWTGTACLSSAMQAQIPATTQDTYYVCPPAS